MWPCCRAISISAIRYRVARNPGCPYCSGRVVKPGVNDLLTRNPKLASELVDQTFAATVTAGSSKKALWRCSKGHPPWLASVNDRATGHGCPYCSGHRTIQGTNDLATTHPRIARELADRSLARALVAGSRRRVEWICPKHGHRYFTTPNHRITLRQGCPFCANRKVLVGFNDLATTDPRLASQLVDRSLAKTVTRGTSSKRLEWKCKKGHRWVTSPNRRTMQGGRGCPICHGSIVIKGVNDLATTNPKVAAELVDPSDGYRLTDGSSRRVLWKCSRGHEYRSSPEKRTRRTDGCPYCGNKRVLAGFNDVATTHPELARSFAKRSLARSLTAGSNRRVKFVCGDCSKVYLAPVSRRALGHGCPFCAIGGFDSTLSGYFYFMKRFGELQIGITNYPSQRISHHVRNGSWQLIDCIGPYEGIRILDFETRIKRWLRKVVGTIAGTKENWKTQRLNANSLTELLDVVGIGMDELLLHFDGCRPSGRKRLAKWRP
jgi:hypothetical protein